MIIEKAREFQKNICFIDYAKTFLWITTNCGKFLEMGIPDHLTCLLRNLYAGDLTVSENWVLFLVGVESIDTTKPKIRRKDLLLATNKQMLLKCCTQYVSEFGKLSSGHRTGKGQFSFQSQRRAMP